MLCHDMATQQALTVDSPADTLTAVLCMVCRWPRCQTGVLPAHLGVCSRAKLLAANTLHVTCYMLPCVSRCLLVDAQLWHLGGLPLNPCMQIFEFHKHCIHTVLHITVHNRRNQSYIQEDVWMFVHTFMYRLQRHEYKRSIQISCVSRTSASSVLGAFRRQAVDPVFQAKMLDMLKQTGRPVALPRQLLVVPTKNGVSPKTVCIRSVFP